MAEVVDGFDGFGGVGGCWCDGVEVLDRLAKCVEEVAAVEQHGGGAAEVMLAGGVVVE